MDEWVQLLELFIQTEISRICLRIEAIQEEQAQTELVWHKVEDGKLLLKHLTRRILNQFQIWTSYCTIKVELILWQKKVEISHSRDEF